MGQSESKLPDEFDEMNGLKIATGCTGVQRVFCHFYFLVGGCLQRWLAPVVGLLALRREGEA